MLSRNKSLFFALFLSLGIAIFVEHRALFDIYAINNDVRNQAYWMLRLGQPTLYPHDLAASYFTQPALVSPFVQGLYGIVSLCLDPIRFSQFLPFVLVLLATGFLFKAASAYVNGRYAFWICMVFNCFIWMIYNLAGGLPRAFFFPLLFLFLWFKAERRWFGILLVSMLQGLIYPPVLFLSWGILLFDLALIKKQHLKERKYGVFLLLAFITSGIILIQRYGFISQQPEFGKLMHGNWAEGMEEFYKGGRVPVFQFHPPTIAEGSFLEYLYDFLIRIPPLMEITPLLITVILFFIYRKTLMRERLGDIPIPIDIWDLLVISIFFYFLSSYILFFLYVPERYIQYTFPLIPVFFIGGLLYKITEIYQTQHLLKPGLVLVTVLVSCCFWRDDLITLYSDQKAVLTYLQTLPPDSMIAASYPIIANDIPVFSRRSVLVNREVAIPFHDRYYKEMKQRLKDWLEAYYSSDSRVIHRFIEKYKIDVLVISQRDYTSRTIDNMNALYFHAFPRQMIAKMVGEYKTGHYALLQVAETCHAFQSGPYKIIPAQCFSALTPKTARTVNLNVGTCKQKRSGQQSTHFPARIKCN